MKLLFYLDCEIAEFTSGAAIRLRKESESL
jgi:hypothetical protein